jgi:hypothetical protein
MHYKLKLFSHNVGISLEISTDSVTNILVPLQIKLN